MNEIASKHRSDLSYWINELLYIIHYNHTLKGSCCSTFTAPLFRPSNKWPMDYECLGLNQLIYFPSAFSTGPHCATSLEGPVPSHLSMDTDSSSSWGISWHLQTNCVIYTVYWILGLPQDLLPDILIQL